MFRNTGPLPSERGDTAGAADVLARGLAAAHAGEADEAIFYLEWALRHPLAPDEAAAAWYGLSRMQRDPAARRASLDQVLALQPGHPEARRDWAILQGQLDPATVVDPATAGGPVGPGTGDPTVEGYPCPRCGHRRAARPGDGALWCAACGTVDPPPAPAPAATLYYCPQCGEAVTVAAGSETLRCPRCGLERALPGRAAAPAVRDRDWTATIYTAQAHRWALPQERTWECAGCGARVVGAPAQVSTVCAFCGAPQVVRAVPHPDLVAPEGVLPFAFAAPAALDHAQAWLARQRFRPGDLDRRAAFQMPRPIYLPFWTFDLGGEVGWAGTVQDHSPFGSRSPQAVSGRVAVYYDDLPVPASPSLPADLLAALPFALAGLVPYRPDLLAAWPAEVYRVAAADASLVARERAYRATVRAVERGTAPGTPDVVDGVRITHNGVLIEACKLVLLPVWVTGYTYGGQVYPVLVDGHGGGAAGAVPRNLVQAALGTLFGG